MQNSCPTLVDCTISQNGVSPVSSGLGGGLYCSGSSPTLSNCTISGNLLGVGPGFGGGVYCTDGSDPTQGDGSFLRWVISIADRLILDLARAASDATCILNWLFVGGADPGCVAAANTNGDDAANITDATYLLNHLFSGAPAPVAPFPDCGPGTLPADADLGCANPPDC